MSVLISIKPKWCAKICHEIGEDETGKPIYEKRIEVRKSAPKEVPFKAYIYQTKGKEKLLSLIKEGDDLYGTIYHGKTVFIKSRETSWYASLCGNEQKVIGEFICDKVYNLFPFGMGTGIELLDEIVSPEQFCKDSCLTEQEICDYIGEKDGYGWHISDLKIYDKPKELSEFYAPCPIENKDCENCIRHGKPYDWDFDEKQGLIYCTRRLSRPPQSWQYIDEVEE